MSDVCDISVPTQTGSIITSPLFFYVVILVILLTFSLEIDANAGNQFFALHGASQSNVTQWRCLINHSYTASILIHELMAYVLYQVRGTCFMHHKCVMEIWSLCHLHYVHFSPSLHNFIWSLSLIQKSGGMNSDYYYYENQPLCLSALSSKIDLVRYLTRLVSFHLDISNSIQFSFYPTSFNQGTAYVTF